MKWTALLWGCVFACTLSAGSASAENLRVNTFPSPQNLPLYVALDKGIFQKHGLSVELLVTPNSKAQREGLINGRFDIAQAGVDNALSAVEDSKADVVIVSGGSSGLNELVVRPEVKSYADIRGKTVVVDAPNTAFALLLYKMLALNGVQRNEYSVFPAGACSFRYKAMRESADRVAAMMNPPCSIQAEKDGYHSLGLSTDVVGRYLADGHWVMRPWAAAHADTLVNYLQAVIEGYRWGVDPTHRDELITIMAKYLKIDRDLAATTINLEIGSNGGMAKDAAFDMEGFKNTLKLRAEFEGGDPNVNPAKYIDLSYYQKALSGLH